MDESNSEMTKLSLFQCEQIKKRGTWSTITYRTTTASSIITQDQTFPNFISFKNADGIEFCMASSVILNIIMECKP